MADIYGIGTAIKASLRIIETAGRGTGRTTALVEVVRPNDVVVFNDSREAARVLRLVKEKHGFELRFMCAPVDDPGYIFRNLVRPGEGGRLLLDHRWVQEYFEHQVDLACRDLENLQTNARAKETARLPITRMADQASAKWGV